MFASKIAKPQTKTAESPTRKLAPQRSVFATRPFGGGAVEQALQLQRSLGNQATLRLLSQRDLSPTRIEHGDKYEEAMTAGKTPRDVSWDFSRDSNTSSRAGKPTRSSILGQRTAPPRASFSRNSLSAMSTTRLSAKRTASPST